MAHLVDLAIARRQTMSSDTQSDLFSDRPRSIEVAGPELVALLDSLRHAGAIVHAIDAICNATWRLSVHWPNEPEKGKRVTPSVHYVCR